jgi:hypothetical protein
MVFESVSATAKKKPQPGGCGLISDDGLSEVEGQARPVVAAHGIKGSFIGVAVERVVLIQDRWLFVIDVVNTDAELDFVEGNTELDVMVGIGAD